MLEDFADLDLSDADGSRNREDRIRAAFEKSKQSYSQELVYTEPGLMQGFNLIFIQWYDPPQIPAPTKLHVRNIDYSLNNLYINQDYARALDLALSQIKEEEGNSYGEGREFQLIDTAIRCALKTGDNELARQLADKTSRKWLSNVGLALTAAEAYLAASRPRDALRAALAAISIRGPQITHVSVLYRAVKSLSEELPESGAIRSLFSTIRAHIQHRISAGAEPPGTIDETTASRWSVECGIAGADQQRLVSLLCYKTSREAEHVVEKSVRTL